MDIRVLMTGFEPFNGERVNPSSEAVRRLDGRVLQSKDKQIHVVATAVPTVFGVSKAVLDAALREARPDVVICVGQAGGRCHFTPERVAINVDDARIPDNAGNQPVQHPVVESGPVAYWSTLPIKRIVQSVAEAGIPASVSNSAGTFVCNHLFYHLMHVLDTQYESVKGGFIHIPYLPEQVTHTKAPSMTLSEVIRALEIAATVAADGEPDLHRVAGTEC